MRVYWSSEDAPEDLVPGLRALGEEYPVFEGAGDGLRVFFECRDGPPELDVSLRDEGAFIVYDRPVRAFRALGGLLAADRAGAFRESVPFTMFGVMVDCSRNAVARVDFLKRWLRRLALLGYDLMMLYTEDTYEVPEEPFFGYLRGRYSQAELKEIDDYAVLLGIEVIPCVQTLAHLEQALRWPVFQDVADTSGTLLAGEEKTYAFLERLIRAASGPVRSRRIHIGMDEAHDLGRGKYMDRFGYRRDFDIFNDHLSRVLEICRSMKLEPMIWSDMYFRMGSKTGDYYDRGCEIPQEVVEQIPEGMQLVYWDYYHDDEDFYAEWIRRHQDLAGVPVVGSGLWTWPKFWYDHRISSAHVEPCLRACKKAGVREVFFTLWGDDGAECDRNSVLAGLAWAAELAYEGEGARPAVEDRFDAVCGGDYEMHLRASDLEYAAGPGARYHVKGFLWDDLLLGTFCRHAEARSSVSARQLAAAYREIGEDVSGAVRGQAGDFDFVFLLCQVVARKLELRASLVEAYQEGDRDTLRALAERLIPELSDFVQALWSAHRKVWFSQNKPFGFEVLTIRYGGLMQRLEEVRVRIGEYLSGSLTGIAELEESVRPVPQMRATYRNLASSSTIL